MRGMVINEAIRCVMKESGVTHKMMADALRMKRGTDVSARLNSKNMTFDRAIEMLSVCGYEVIVQNARRGKRQDWQYLIVKSDAAKKGGDSE